jgi:hypothetical protein
MHSHVKEIRRRKLEARQEGVDVDVGQFLRLVGFGGCGLFSCHPPI